MNLIEELFSDVHIRHSLYACIQCGICTGVCPAAQIYDYDPRILVNLVQKRNEQVLTELLQSDYIWYCGECMSCKTRCPRDNTPGEIVIALRQLSQRKGYFVSSRRGRQQYVIRKTIGESILQEGYCVYFDHVDLDRFPEQGPTWQWVRDHRNEILSKVGASYQQKTAGPMRKIREEDLQELKKIFEVTGASQLFQLIDDYSRNVMMEENKSEEEYIREIFEK
ncbi:MAG: 4Fe-4S dicluster domain-containing protein [Bacteroidales bacterium]|nr:4Fe-4S dicluster domain-containing protein [Bacteroidales bacterium]